MGQNRLCVLGMKALSQVMDRKTITSTIDQQMHLYDFHLKHFKTLQTPPTCFEVF